MNKQQSAFTLIELLLTISIIAIIMGNSLPSFNNFLDKQKVKANVQRLTQTLQSARLKAINNNVKVTLCPFDNTVYCSSNWSTGYMSFIDKNGDRQFNNDDILLSQYFSSEEKAVLAWKAFGPRKSLQWLATGITNHQNGSFEFCYGDKAENARALFLTKPGRIRKSKDSDNDNIHENSTGGFIRC